MNLSGFFSKTRPILSLFHAPSSKASARVLNLVQTAHADAEASNPGRAFTLEVEQGAPTATQLRSMLDMLGGDGAGSRQVGDLVPGAVDVGDAMRLAEGKAGAEVLRRPVLVDWNNGKVVLGTDESQIKALLDGLK